MNNVKNSFKASAKIINWHVLVFFSNFLTKKKRTIITSYCHYCANLLVTAVLCISPFIWSPHPCLHLQTGHFISSSKPKTALLLSLITGIIYFNNMTIHLDVYFCGIFFQELMKHFKLITVSGGYGNIIQLIWSTSRPVS